MSLPTNDQANSKSALCLAVSKLSKQLVRLTLTTTVFWISWRHKLTAALSGYRIETKGKIGRLLKSQISPLPNWRSHFDCDLMTSTITAVLISCWLQQVSFQRR